MTHQPSETMLWPLSFLVLSFFVFLPTKPAVVKIFVENESKKIQFKHIYAKPTIVCATESYINHANFSAS